MDNLSFINISLYHYLFLSLFLFLIGIMSFVLSKSDIKIVISTIFILCSVNINFCAFSAYFDKIHYIGFTASVILYFLFIFEILALFYVNSNSNSETVIKIEEIKK